MIESERDTAEEEMIDVDDDDLAKYKIGLDLHELYLATADLPLMTQIQMAKNLVTSHGDCERYSDDSDPALVMADALLTRVSKP